jgi:nucleoside-diphosphate-sugar epimerase
MRIFVTGGSGYIGSAVVRAAVKAGHEVGALFHSADKEPLVRALGAVPIKGNLKDPETYQHFAAESKAVIHCALESPETDAHAAEILTSALVAEGEDRALVFTSGVWTLGNTEDGPADENAPTDNPAPISAWRPAVERYVLTHGNEQIATAIVRPGIVYGGKRGIIAQYFASAVNDGAATFIGTGQNHVPLVHVDDLARLYLLVAEKRARGVFHGTDGTFPKVEEIASACSRAAGKGGVTKSITLEVARQQMGPFADAMVLDQRVISPRSAELGWKPSRKNFFESAEAAFKEWRS